MSRKKQAEKIKLDVINWSKTVLEPMNKHIGFPACPFAAKWRKDGKVRIKASTCKNKYCVKQGWSNRFPIICIPNEVSVVIKSKKKEEMLITR